jgi:hypothetical protein
LSLKYYTHLAADPLQKYASPDDYLPNKMVAVEAIYVRMPTLLTLQGMLKPTLIFWANAEQRGLKDKHAHHCVGSKF